VDLDLREAGETCSKHRVARLTIADIADYIDAFYNRTWRHSHLGGLSPEQFEVAHKVRRQGLH
jgi:putative transposase